jgi:hypothetical protein
VKSTPTLVDAQRSAGSCSSGCLRRGCGCSAARRADTAAAIAAIDDDAGGSTRWAAVVALSTAPWIWDRQCKTRSFCLRRRRRRRGAPPLFVSHNGWRR